MPLRKLPIVAPFTLTVTSAVNAKMLSDGGVPLSFINFPESLSNNVWPQRIFLIKSLNLGQPASQHSFTIYSMLLNNIGMQIMQLSIIRLT